MAINFNQRTLALNAVIDWVAAQGNSKSLLKKNVAQRVRDAVKKGALKEPKVKGSQKHVNTLDFFTWACEQKGWEILKQANPPRSTVVGVEGVSAHGSVYFYDSDKDKRIAELEEELRTCQEELNNRKERSEQAGRSGRLGGRPKKEINS
jgi:hypothetical protein